MGKKTSTSSSETQIGKILYDGTDNRMCYVETFDIRAKCDFKQITTHFEILYKLNPISFRFTGYEKSFDGFIL